MMIQEIFNEVLTSLFILFFGFLFADILKKFSAFILKELRVNKSLKGVVEFNFEKNISIAVYYFVFFISVFFSLQNLGVTGYFLFSWFIFVMVIFAISFVLDIKDGFINLFYWFKFGKKLKKGLKISTDVISGKIIKHSFFGVTVLKNSEEHYIPNNFLVNGFVLK